MRWKLIGWVAKGNFGDELMMDLAIQKICRIDRMAQIEVLVRKRIVPEWRSDLPNVTYSDLGGPYNILRTAGVLRGGSLFVWVGGTCFHEGAFATYLDGVIAKLMGIPVYWLGVGSDSFVSRFSKFKARVAIWATSYVFWRDDRSHQIATTVVSDHRSEVTEDLALLLSDNELAKCYDSSLAVSTHEYSESYAVLSWIEFTDANQSTKEAVDSFVQAVLPFLSKSRIERVKVVSFCTVFDREATDYLAIKLGEHSMIDVEVFLDFDLQEMMSVIRSAEFVFSIRLHPLLVAKLLNVPAFGVAYSRKVLEMEKGFDRRITTSFSRVVEDPQAVQLMLEEEFREPAKYVEQVRSLRDAEKNFEMLL